MTALTLGQETTIRLRKAAAQSGEQPEALAERAIRQFLHAEARRAIHREAEAFRAQHAELLTSYRDQYVAIYQGQVIDHDLDQLTLLARVEEHYPDTPVFIAQVLSEPEETYTIRSPRWEGEL